MSKAGYSAITPAAVALTAGAARSVLGVLAPATFGLEVKKVRVGTLGTAAAVPGDIELCMATFATQPPGGGNSTAVTPQQIYGPRIDAGFLAATAWTANNEPTILTVIDSWTLTPNSGTVLYDLPLGDSPDCVPGAGFVLRAKFAAATSVSAALWVERC
jgi:hypothetical protein